MIVELQSLFEQNKILGIIFIIFGSLLVIPLLFLLLKILINLYKFSWKLVFSKPQHKNDYNSDNKETSKISINNVSPIKDNMDMIEFTKMQFEQNMNNKNFADKLDMEKSLKINQIENKLNIEQSLKLSKIENQMIINELKYAWDKEKNELKNQINALATQLKKETKQKTSIVYDNNETNNDKDSSINFNTREEQILKELKEHIPSYLTQIFDKVENIENLQLFILNNNINDKNDISRYDSQKNVLYIKPNDYIYAQLLISDKNKEQKKLN